MKKGDKKECLMLSINIVAELKYLLKLGLAFQDQQGRGHIVLEVQRLKILAGVAVTRCRGEGGYVEFRRRS